MAEYGEWNRKGATLSHVTAEAEYGVSLDFITKGIQAKKLEYREGSIWGNPYLKILRSHLENYIRDELGTINMVAVLSMMCDRKLLRTPLKVKIQP